MVVCLVHGPSSTYASDLWELADQRILIDRDFMIDVARERSKGKSRRRHSTR